MISSLYRHITLTTLPISTFLIDLNSLIRCSSGVIRSCIIACQV